jgi:hypothetical protein
MEPELVLQKLLLGTGFAGFCFATCFSLRFQRQAQDSAAPWEVVLELDCHWLLEPRQDWVGKGAERASGKSEDDEEAMQAFDLVRLRWGGLALVTGVDLTEGGLRITLDAGEQQKSLLIPPVKDDESWELYDSEDRDSGWAVTQNPDEIHLRKPS